MNPARILFALLFGLALAACSSATSSNSPSGDPSHDSGPGPQPGPGPKPPYPYDDATSMVVGLDVEDFRPTIGVSLDSVHIVAKVDGQVAADETLDLRAGNALPHETTLKSPKDKKDAPIEVTVEGSGPLLRDGPPQRKPNVSRLVSTRFVPGEARVIPIRLEARCAQEGPQAIGGAIFLGPQCDAPTTCVAAKCVSDVVDPQSLPKYSKTWQTDMPDACRAGAPSVTVGTGQNDFTSLKTGDTVQLVEGPQCGHHLWLGVQMAGMRQYGSRTLVTSVVPGTSIVGPAAEFDFSYGDAGNTTCSLAGLRYQLEGVTGGGATSWKDVLGKPLELTVEVRDPSGKTEAGKILVNVDATYAKSAGRACGP